MSEQHQPVWEGKYLRVKVCGSWEYAERPNSPAGIVIIAITPEGELLLTEQYRVPMRKEVIELPAGLAGDEEYSGEEYIEAAKRELLEEAGYEADEWEQLAIGPTSAGLSNEQIVFFSARSLRKVSEGGGKGSEKIRLHKIPLRQVNSWLREMERQGLLIDTKIYSGLYLLEQSSSGSPSE